MQIPTSSMSFTERAQRHKDGSVVLSVADDRICKLNGVGALTWMVLEENPAGLKINDVVRELDKQFDAINAEGQLRYEVSPEQLRNDTARFLKKIAEMNLVRIETDSHGQELYYIREGVNGTTSTTVASAEVTSSRTSPNASVTPPSAPHGRPLPSSEHKVVPLKRETFTAFIGLLAFDFLLKFAGFQRLITKVERWPTAAVRTKDPDICNRVRAMVDRAQMFYPKKAMCLQHSAVVTCLLRRRGVLAEMVLAAQEFPPKGHAWVEVEGKVINDRQVVKDQYRVLKRI